MDTLELEERVIELNEFVPKFRFLRILSFMGLIAGTCLVLAISVFEVDTQDAIGAGILISTSILTSMGCCSAVYMFYLSVVRDKRIKNLVRSIESSRELREV